MGKLLAREFSILLAAAAFVLALAGADAARAERRIALVVGNSAYQTAGISLSNPKNDAKDMAAALAGLGFEVVTAMDATKRDMDLALQKFARLATDADSALFFYAGHAMQFQGRNFLMPTDAELEDEISVRYQMVGMEEVFAALDRANGVKIMILDACRNNPLADRLQKSLSGTARSVGSTRGLARIDKTQGTVIAYATAADEVAQDGRSRNSPFTAALLKRLAEPGLEVEVLLRRVAKDVNDQTGGRQRPETYISLQSEYYLNQNDRIAWDRIRDQDDVKALRDFLATYRSSRYAVAAHERLDQLGARDRDDTARRAREEAQYRDQYKDKFQIAKVDEPRSPRMPSDKMPSDKMPPANVTSADIPPAANPPPVSVPPVAPAKVPQATLPRVTLPPAALPYAPVPPPAVQQAAVQRPDEPTTGSNAAAAIRYSDPIPFGPFPVNGQSIEKLITGTPLFPPIAGLDEKLWKHDCSSCHRWDQRTLCDQGQTYIKNPAYVFRHQHPYGGPFKVAVLEWAKTGCR